VVLIKEEDVGWGEVQYLFWKTIPLNAQISPEPKEAKRDISTGVSIL
jgi:hypothetical protein